MLSLLVLTTISLGQPQESSKIQKTTGSVSGKVTLKGKGMAGVVVVSRRPQMFNPFESSQRAVTDQDGNYKIRNIVAGSYQILTTAPGYVVTEFNRRTRSIIVGEGEDVEGINFTLIRGGVITGRVKDAEGRPVVQQQVQLTQVDQPEQTNATGPVNYPPGSTATDDRGIYRIYGLMPGRYKVSVGRGEETMAFSLSSKTTYKQVFYPDVTDANKASVVEVGEGTEATNIDITLGPTVETYSARGRVIDAETGQPVRFVRMGMQQLSGPNNDRSVFVDTYTSTNARGEFSADGLTPGKYSLFVMQDGQSEMRTDATTFDVIDSDVSGITIQLVKGAAISGVIILESDDKQARAKLSNLQVQAYVQTPGRGSNNGNASQSPVGPDGSFRLAGLTAGLAFFNLAPFRDVTALKGFFVSRIERDGVVQPGGIEVKDGEQVSGIRLVVEYGTAVLHGRINIENGLLPPGARIFVRMSKPGDPQSTIGSAPVDERLRFVVDAIPAGTYELTVGAIGSRRRLGRPVRQQVVLQNNIVTEVTINLDLSEAAKP
jgi:protocatechuate 3,4-dioxygenase beta subunit